MHERQDDRPDWDLRPWLLAGIGLVAGLIAHFILGDGIAARPTAADISLAAFTGSLAILTGFTLEKLRWQWSLIFALAAALVIALVFWWNGAPDDWGTAEGWRMTCGFLAVAIAAPLFQAARDAGAARFDYEEVHSHAWTNVVMWCAACAFVGAVFLLAFLLSELFGLIGIDLLKDALGEQWFGFALAGTAFGAAIGVLRERDRIVRLLLGIVLAVLGVLAPVLAAGLVLFLLSLPFTGLDALWEATKSTTPILLMCVIGALILANAAIGRSAEEESRFAPLRWGAMALGLAMLPLAVIAAVSTGLRIEQYGFTPDRLWALVFVIVATAYGLAYLVSLVRGRMEWAARVRPANLRLAFATCALALFLALPILSFNAISTRDQLARLESGRVSPDRFDWAALRFDFGAPGEAAVRRLAKSANAAVRQRAAQAMKGEHRWDIEGQAERVRRAVALEAGLKVIPEPVPLPPGLLEAFNNGNQDKNPAYLFYRPGEATAALVLENCGRRKSDDDCRPHVETVWRDRNGKWQQGGWHIEGDDDLTPQLRADLNRKLRDGMRSGSVEVRSVVRRQVFVNGEPLGQPF